MPGWSVTQTVAWEGALWSHSSCPSPLGKCPNMHICQHVLTQWANTCMS